MLPSQNHLAVAPEQVSPHKDDDLIDGEANAGSGPEIGLSLHGASTPKLSLHCGGQESYRADRTRQPAGQSKKARRKRSRFGDCNLIRVLAAQATPEHDCVFRLSQRTPG